MGKLVVYYHIYLTDDAAAWSSIFLEQMKCMEDHELLKKIDEVQVTAVGKNDRRRTEFFNLCDTYPANFEIEFVDNPLKNDTQMVTNIDKGKIASENITYQKIWDDCQKKDQTVLYLHSKGITSFERLLKTDTKEGARAFKRYYYWRQFLNWGAIENWRAMINALDTHDVAGINYQAEPSPHFSGAFWWSTSKHIRTLPDPSTNDWWKKVKSKSKDPWFSKAPDRYKDEHWVTQGDKIKIFNLIKNKINPYHTLLTKDKYKG